MSPKHFDPDDVLERAMDVFWAKGFEATSAQDLVAAMGINRGSMYATFGSKRQLYERALERYLERDRATLVAALSGGAPLRESLGRLLRSYANQLLADPEHRGCFLVNACAELTPGEPVLAARLTEELDAHQRLLEDAVRAARARDESLGSQDAESVAAFLVGVIQGLRVVGKATGDRDRLERIIELTLEAVGGERMSRSS